MDSDSLTKPADDYFIKAEKESNLSLIVHSKQKVKDKTVVFEKLNKKLHEKIPKLKDY